MGQRLLRLPLSLQKLVAGRAHPRWRRAPPQQAPAHPPARLRRVHALAQTNTLRHKRQGELHMQRGTPHHQPQPLQRGSKARKTREHSDAMCR
jgi:hypothetical protein